MREKEKVKRDRDRERVIEVEKLRECTEYWLELAASHDAAQTISLA